MRRLERGEGAEGQAAGVVMRMLEVRSGEEGAKDGW
jgi:hypothetical protein